MTTREKAARTFANLRANALAVYKNYRARMDYANYIPASVYDAACAEWIAARGLPAGPLAYLEAARSIAFRCGRCGGTGRFVTGSVNGQLVGPGGNCFRCQGRGVQTDADARRNWGADMHQSID